MKIAQNTVVKERTCVLQPHHCTVLGPQCCDMLVLYAFI